ncbi:hypothetical protein A3Q56_03642 [Intoshia linei]|uniref:Uncharacterized protein n=1 Tax=Intoshia linei TaxID=1819745 RepID=A0A177B2U7_9BILA|nr:hypothetical protein A3Q56_03642 [Intoshia linei]
MILNNPTECVNITNPLREDTYQLEFYTKELALQWYTFLNKAAIKLLPDNLIHFDDTSTESKSNVYWYTSDFNEFIKWPTIVYSAHAVSILAQSINTSKIITNSILFLINTALLVTSCFSEKKYHEPTEGKCPEIWASFFSRITYHWLNGPLWLGVKKTITESDLWKLPRKHQTDIVYKKFEKVWNKHLKSTLVSEFNEESRFSELIVNIEPKVTEVTPLIYNGKKNTPKTVSLFKILFKKYGIIYFIDFNEDDNIHVWKRYGIAFLFFPVTFIGSLALHYIFAISTKLSVDIYSCICTAIYDKILIILLLGHKTKKQD